MLQDRSKDSHLYKLDQLMLPRQSSLMSDLDREHLTNLSKDTAEHVLATSSKRRQRNKLPVSPSASFLKKVPSDQNLKMISSLMKKVNLTEGSP